MDNEKNLNINEEEKNKEDINVEVKEKKTSKSKKAKDEAKEKKKTTKKSSTKKTTTSKKTSEAKKSTTTKKSTTKKSTTSKNSNTTRKTTTPKKSSTKKKESNTDKTSQEEKLLKTENEEDVEKLEIKENVEIKANEENIEIEKNEESIKNEISEEDAEIDGEEQEKQDVWQEKINEKLQKMQDVFSIDLQTVKQNVIEEIELNHDEQIEKKEEQVGKKEELKNVKSQRKREKEKNLQEKKLRGVSLVWLIAMITVIAVLLNSSYNIYKILTDYQKIEEENNELVDNFTYVEDVNGENENKDLEKNNSSETAQKTDGFKVKWEEIKKMNEEVCAWIIIPGTKINYPVLKSDIHDKYLKTNVYGKHSNGGSIFIDSNTIEPFNTNNTIIYGHNLNNGEMFSELRNFKDENFAKENNKIKIVMEDNSMKTYQIFAFYEIASDDFDIYNTNVSNLEDYYELIKNNNTINVTEKIDTTKPIITLSTCTNYNEGTRFIVQAFCED